MRTVRCLDLRDVGLFFVLPIDLVMQILNVDTICMTPEVDINIHPGIFHDTEELMEVRFKVGRADHAVAFGFRIMR